ncbi:wee1-like protein kinase-like [Hibiscus syriacus]|uniref:Wee1-like protein kinase-like n=1 Tax=Hibiscus syriacus TaxID=106335 RepID=A0A6A2Y7K2_HIBSY|nr:wee1-like protein kinase-like [Hibiscus syriacus]
MLGTSMVIGDGVLTPCISGSPSSSFLYISSPSIHISLLYSFTSMVTAVLSAVGGIKNATYAMTDDRIVWISTVILVCLFMVQRFGTDKVGYTFAPIICVWFTLIAGIGIYNFFRFDPSVIRAMNPKYIVYYFRRNKKHAWVSLCGVVLVITGTEALFADVGHFTVRSIQISMCSVTYPALIMAYTGKASFLLPFVRQLSVAICRPSLLADIRDGCGGCDHCESSNDFWAFSIIQQSLSLGCFPRVKIVHTSAKYEGQVYIPEVNYLLMLACVGVTLGFKTTEKMGNAYGIAVVFVMALTSSLLVLIMIMIWKTNILFVIAYVLIICSVELTYLSSVLYKFDQGCIPPIFEHYVENIQALHWVLVFVSIKSLPISKVPAEDRFLFRRVEPNELSVFRCVVRYGYTDIRNEEDSLELISVEKLKEFIKENILLAHVLDGKKANGGGEVDDEWREIRVVDRASEAGVVHLIGESEVVASKGSRVAKRLWIDHAYNFMKKN